MLHPWDNVGKIVKVLERYYDPNENKIKAKSRPNLIIGYEFWNNYPQFVDYELLPISRIENHTPHPEYDVLVSDDVQLILGLDYPSYIRTHKTSWSNVKYIKIEEPIGNLREIFPDMFNRIMALNREWVNSRTEICLNPNIHRKASSN